MYRLLRSFLFQDAGAAANEGNPRLRLQALLLALSCGLLAVTGCGSSINYTCNNDICTATQPAAQLQLSAAAYRAAAGTGEVPLKLVVTRSGHGDGPVSVHFSTSDGSGIAGLDYTARAGTLHWAAGDRRPKTVSVVLQNQQTQRPSRTFTVSLSSPSEGAALGNVASAVVMLEGDDAVAGR